MQFSKKTLTMGELASHLGELTVSASGLIAAFRSDRVDSAFSERLMLAVTSVLRCRYCNWMHSDLASHFGVAGEEISMLLQGNLESVDAGELPALQFAVHFAESEGRYSTTEMARLKTHYDEDTVRDIFLLIQFVYFTNKLGNTFDSGLARFQGKESANPNLFLELPVLLCMMPLYGAVSYFTKKGRNPFVTLEE